MFYFLAFALVLRFSFSCHAAVLSTPDAVTHTSVPFIMDPAPSISTAASPMSSFSSSASTTSLYTATTTCTTCVSAAVVTSTYTIFGYTTATPTPSLTNYYPRQGFHANWLIGGNSIQLPVTDGPRVAWQCQYSCGTHCLAYFVFWDISVDGLGYWNCWIFAQRFTTSDLISSPNRNKTHGAAFNRCCVDGNVTSLQASIGSGTVVSSVVAIVSDISISSSITSPICRPFTATLTITRNPVPSATSTSWTKSRRRSSWSIYSTAATSTYSATHGQTTFTPATIKPNTTTTSSVCTPTQITTDGYTFNGYAEVTPTRGVSDNYVHQFFWYSHFIDRTQISVGMNERGHAEFLCHFKCLHRCFSWIVIWVGSDPSGLKGWVCEIFSAHITYADLVQAPPEYTLGAVFNKICQLLS